MLCYKTLCVVYCIQKINNILADLDRLTDVICFFLIYSKGKPPQNCVSRQFNPPYVYIKIKIRSDKHKMAIQQISIAVYNT